MEESIWSGWRISISGVPFGFVKTAWSTISDGIGPAEWKRNALFQGWCSLAPTRSQICLSLFSTGVLQGGNLFLRNTTWHSATFTFVLYWKKNPTICLRNWGVRGGKSGWWEGIIQINQISFGLNITHGKECSNVIINSGSIRISNWCHEPLPRWVLFTIAQKKKRSPGSADLGTKTLVMCNSWHLTGNYRCSNKPHKRGRGLSSGGGGKCEGRSVSVWGVTNRSTEHRGKKWSWKPGNPNRPIRTENSGGRRRS